MSVAYDGLAAVALAVAEAPQVVLLDIAMPGLDGWGIARELRGLPQLDEVRLIAISGLGRSVDIERSLEAGFEAHLTKPVDTERLSGLLG